MSDRRGRRAGSAWLGASLCLLVLGAPDLLLAKELGPPPVAKPTQVVPPPVAKPTQVVPPPAESMEECGPAHRTELQEVLSLRNPGVRTSDNPPALDRALIIEDFLRLKAVGSPVVAASGLQHLEEAFLRRARDGGFTTPEVCALIHFMRRYYVATRGPVIPAPVVASVPKTPEPVVASAPRAPEPVGTPVLEAPAAVVAAVPKLPASIAATAEAVAPRERVSAFAAPLMPVPAPVAPPPRPVLRPSAVPTPPRERMPAYETALTKRNRADAVLGAALPWISEVEDQLRVPRYLSFRETRVELPLLADEEIERRQAASLEAAQRVVVLLSVMRDDPALRRAVQKTLGAQGRARIGKALLDIFENVPDSEQRTRALYLWGQVELVARDAR